MPELPEVEVLCRGIRYNMVGHTVLHVIVRNVKLRKLVSDKIVTLKNQYVVSVTRRAKYLFFEFNTGYIIGHLGMTGSLKVLKVWEYSNQCDHFDFIMDNGFIIRYSDPRKFGSWVWKDKVEADIFLMSFGVEPLSTGFSGIWLFNKFHNSKRLVKLLLMDNKVISGIGNIYANESLFLAGIMPNRLICSLDKNEMIKLANSIKQVLVYAINCGGTTIRNYFHSDGSSGNFFLKLWVYRRSGRSCLVCGSIVQKKRYSGRSTFFCSICQS